MYFGVSKFPESTILDKFLVWEIWQNPQDCHKTLYEQSIVIPVHFLGKGLLIGRYAHIVGSPIKQFLEQGDDLELVRALRVVFGIALPPYDDSPFGGTPLWYPSPPTPTPTHASGHNRHPSLCLSFILGLYHRPPAA